MKIGIMGGVFDPLHFGHLQAGEIAKEKLKLSKVLFVVSGLPPHKPKPIANKEDRFNILKLCLKNNKQFIPLDLEIKRDGYTWTIDTIKEIKDIYGDNDYYFIIGTDTIPELCKWKDIDTIFNIIKFVAITREGFHYEDRRIILIEFPTLPVSSSFIRERIKNGLSVRYLMPDIAIKYIQKRGLYS